VVQSLSADRMRALAVAGARVRLEELREEIALLERLLRDSGASTVRRQPGARRRTRKRGQLSPAGRAAIVAAQKARWAQANAATAAARPRAAQRDATPSRGRRKRSGMSAAARKAVSERMRKYWAARRKAAARKAPAAAKG
jgi:hypothetical protein